MKLPYPLACLLCCAVVFVLYGCDEPRPNENEGTADAGDNDTNDDDTNDDDTNDDDTSSVDATPGPAGTYEGGIAGAALATVSGEPWEAPCSGDASVTVDDAGLAQGTFLCASDELSLPIEGYFAAITLPGESPAQLQVGEATVSLEWRQEAGEAAIAFVVEGSMAGPAGSDASATIGISGSLALQGAG